MLKKLSVRLALAIILVMIILLSLFTIYLTRDRAAHMNKLMMEKGITCAKTGATIMRGTFESINDNGFFTLSELFDLRLVPIRCPKWIEDQYAGVSQQERQAIQKYHYQTGLDSYLDNAILEIQDQFLEDPQVIYAALLDKHGYLPTHNSKYSRKPTGDFTYDLAHSRSKRVYSDSIAVKACTNTTEPYVVSIYKRDTGEVMLDFGAPVFVKGHHWGVFRIGFSLKDTEEALSALRNKLILMMSALAVILVLVVGQITGWMMRPLHKLNEGVKLVAQGDLTFQQNVTSSDEVGELAQAFNKMVTDLNTYIKNLTETTAIKEKIESELRIAHDIQMGILPKIFPPFPDIKEIDLYAILTPAKEVGGDFYDFFLMDDDHLCLLIGDVSGKGVPASLLMAVTITLLRSKANKGMTPDEILAKVNRDLCAENEKFMFVTLFLAILNIKTGKVQYSNGGHNPPYILHPDGHVETVKKMPTLALGIKRNFPFQTQTIVLQRGETLFLYTDGVTEAMDEKDEEYGTERLEKDLEPMTDQSPIEMIQILEGKIERFAGTAPQSDDITMVALKYLGA
ncbi:SpoIIE family protein phosphatase [candidate division KSB1 bacterium]|nr:SpoIIE family protein phosphatase [candidate division KSB1 bacterium]